MALMRSVHNDLTALPMSNETGQLLVYFHNYVSRVDRIANTRTIAPAADCADSFRLCIPTLRKRSIVHRGGTSV